MRACQFQQLQVLLQHALQHVPYYRDRYEPEFVDPGLRLTAEHWRELPVLRRIEVQENTEQLLSLGLPPEHGAVLWNQSTGSTGRPIRFATSELSQQMMHAFKVRDLDWQGWRTQHKVAVILSRSEHAQSLGWGPGFDEVYETGAIRSLDARNDIATQARWLEAELPVYLISAVTNLAELARYCLAENIRLPGLRQVRAEWERRDDGPSPNPFLIN